MNKSLINFAVTIILAAGLALVLPWWSVMLAAFITSTLITLKKAAVFFIPFLAVGLYWAIYCFVLSSTNDFTLATKIAQLLPLGGNPYLLILATGLIGGLAAGVSAVFGKQVVVVVRGEKK